MVPLEESKSRILAEHQHRQLDLVQKVAPWSLRMELLVIGKSSAQDALEEMYVA